MFGIPRFVLVLGANISGNYNLVSIIFVVMWIAPFILLNREGRRAIGLRGRTNARWLFYGLVIGISGALAMYLIGHMLYGDSLRNWFVYISGTYSIPRVNLEEYRLLVFLIFAAVSMTFSPIGEEFMYRGLIHASFVPRFGENKASVLDSLAFALTHLAHFGIIYVAGGWHFYLFPAFLWVAMMFFASRLFFLIKQRSGSIWGAVITHAGFNLGMTYCILYWIL
jgi:CAAX protease family protein